MAYLLDSDVLIEARKRHYGMDFCPAFWDWLVTAQASGTVFSVEQVRREISQGTDELVDWVRGPGSKLFLPEPDDLDVYLKMTSEWLNDQGYSAQSVSRFLAGADYYLVSQAMAQSHTVVTHEKVRQGRASIPNVCEAFGTAWMDPYQMLRAEHARFVLG